MAGINLAPIGRSLAVVAVAAALVSGCTVAVAPSAREAGAETTPTPTLPPPTTSSPPQPAPSATDRCPDRPFDVSASLGPEFDYDVFVRDESRSIAQAFVIGLAEILAGSDGVDLCDWFTNQGWASAVLWDERLAAADRGELIVDQAPTLRVAFENEYDLRLRPPTDPLDIIFDIDAGATTTNVGSGKSQRTESVERVGVHVDFMYDGHRWRADRVAAIDPQFRDGVVLPTVPPPGPPCGGFVRDAVTAPFDEDPDRIWCDGDGGGHTILKPDQLMLFVRYPCGDGTAAVLNIGRPLGVVQDRLIRWEYVRDPDDQFLVQRWITEPFDGAATMPDDATYSGWTNGNVDLWISPTELDRAVYLIRGTSVERWARTVPIWGVTDCN
jgi:hypothetical protein